MAVSGPAAACLPSSRRSSLPPPLCPAALQVSAAPPWRPHGRKGNRIRHLQRAPPPPVLLSPPAPSCKHAFCSLFALPACVKQACEDATRAALACKAGTHAAGRAVGGWAGQRGWVPHAKGQNLRGHSRRNGVGERGVTGQIRGAEAVRQKDAAAGTGWAANGGSKTPNLGGWGGECTGRARTRFVLCLR